MVCYFYINHYRGTAFVLLGTIFLVSSKSTSRLIWFSDTFLKIRYYESFGTFIGFVFPSCECGIVLIITRFLEKKVPSYTAIPFWQPHRLLTPSYYLRLIRLLEIAGAFRLRLLGAIVVAMTLGIMLGFVVDDNILKENAAPCHFHNYSNEPWYRKIFLALAHAIDELFDTGRYLVFGSLIASAMQIYLPTRILTTIGGNSLTAILIMMLLAFILSLCSEADAFIGASLLSLFGTAPVLAFL